MKIKKILSILIALTFTSIALPSISFADALCNDGTISKAVKGDKAACANNGGVKQWDDGTPGTTATAVPPVTPNQPSQGTVVTPNNPQTTTTTTTPSTTTTSTNPACQPTKNPDGTVSPSTDPTCQTTQPKKASTPAYYGPTALTATQVPTYTANKKTVTCSTICYNLSWKYGKDKPLKKQTLTISGVDGALDGRVFTYGATTRSQLIQGLTPGVEYTFTLKAPTVKSKGKKFTSDKKISTPVAKASKPLDLSLDVIGSSAKLKWAYLGDSVDFFNVKVITNNNLKGAVTYRLKPNKSEFRIDGISTLKSYQFLVYGSNLAGSGTAAQVSHSSMLPSEPKDFKGVYDEASGSVKFTWESAGTSVDKYYLKITSPGNSKDNQILTYEGDKTSSTVSGLTAGASYLFTLTASNTLGSVNSQPFKLVLQTVPSAPKNLLGDPDDGAVTLSWQLPDVFGSGDLQSYAVEQSSDGGNNWVRVAENVKSLQTVIKQLNNGQRYSFRVKALNGFGVSKPSNSVTLVPSTTPYSPTQVKTSASANNITISWVNPSNTSPIYRIEYRVKNTVDSNNLADFTVASSSVTGTSYTLSNLNFSTLYDIHIVNTNAPATAKADVFAPSMETAPNKVLSLRGTPSLTGTTVDLVWDKPAVNNGGGVSGYKVEVSKDGLPFQTLSAFNIAEKYTALNLSPTSTYLFRVSAFNKFGIFGEVSTSINPSLTLPTEPNNLVAIGDDKSVTLTWQLPSSFGTSDLTGYVVEQSLDNGTIWTKASDSVKKLSTTISGLTNGQKYSFRVRATNESGISKPSNVVTATPIEAPYLPTGVTTSASGNSITLNWVNPTTGTPLYKVEYRVSNSIAANDLNTFTVASANVSGTTYTISNLNLATKYAIKITNVNAPTGAKSEVNAPAIETAPSKVLNLRANSLNSSVELLWEKPIINNNGSIAGYKVEMNLGNSWSTVTSLAINERFLVGSIDPTKSYKFRVTAVNKDGILGETSAEVTATSKAKPGAPLKLTVSRFADEFATVYFEPPANNVEGTSTSAYTYRIEHSLDGISWVVDNASGKVSSNSSSTTASAVQMLDKNENSFFWQTPLVTGPGFRYRIDVKGEFNKFVTSGTSTVTPGNTQTTGATAQGISSFDLVSTIGMLPNKTTLKAAFLPPSGSTILSITGNTVTISGLTIAPAAGASDVTFTTTQDAYNEPTKQLVQCTFMKYLDASTTSWSFSASDTLICGADTIPLPYVNTYYDKAGVLQTQTITNTNIGITEFKIQTSNNIGGAGVSSIYDGFPKYDTFGSCSLATFNLPCQLNGLQSGYTYQVRVTTISDTVVGDSATSSIKLTGAPSAVKNPVAKFSGSKVNITYTSPDSDGGSPITSYILQYSTDGENWNNFSRKVNSASECFSDARLYTSYSASIYCYGFTPNGKITISNGDQVLGLNQFDNAYFLNTFSVSSHYYQFRIKAFNSVSLDRNITPNIPIGFSTDVVTDQSYSPQGLTGKIENGVANLSWSKNPYDSNVSTYRVEYSTDNWANKTVVNASTSSTAISISNLQLGTDYSFRVFSVNDSGSLSVPAQIDITSDVVVDKVLNLTAIDGNASGQVILSWNKPSAGSVSSYKVKYKKVSESAFTTSPTLPSTNTNYTVSSLDNGYDYIFVVYAISGGVDGTESSINFIPHSKPSAVTSLTSTNDSTKVTLSWKKPLNDGGFTTLYYWVQASKDKVTWVNPCYAISSSTSSNYLSPNATCLQTALSFETSNLEKDVVYFFKVTPISTNPKTASTVIGSSSEVQGTLATVATPPINFTLTKASDSLVDTIKTPDSVAVKWTPLNPATTTVTGYIVLLKRTGFNPVVLKTPYVGYTNASYDLVSGVDYQAVETTVGSDKVLTFYNLQSNTPYQIQVGYVTQALDVNNAPIPGSDKLVLSDLQNYSFTNTTLPDIVFNTASVVTGATSATVSWDIHPYSGGTLVTGFELQLSADGGTTWQFISINPVGTSKNYSIDLSGFAPASTYKVRVLQINAVGSGLTANAPDIVIP